jgi:hypothetical protein
VHIHKAGGTSVERALDPYLAWNDLILGGSALGERMQAPYLKKFGLNKHSAVSDIESVCGRMYLDEYYLFALVRHPVARICSIYNFAGSALNNWAARQSIPLSEVASRITPQAAKKTPALKWASSQAFLRTSCFSEFIREEKLKAAPGFRSQVSTLSTGPYGPLKGKFFRLEDYPQWAEPLGKRLGLEFSLPHMNPSGLRLIEPDAVSAGDRALIEENFGVDYEAFGYHS